MNKYFPVFRIALVAGITVVIIAAFLAFSFHGPAVGPSTDKVISSFQNSTNISEVSSSPQQAAQINTTNITQQKKMTELPQGAQTYNIANGVTSGPKFIRATIDPLDVKPGETQRMSVVLSSTKSIANVYAEIEHDAGKDKVLLALNQDKSQADNFVYEGSWIVHDTHSETYRTTFRAKDIDNIENSITLAWSDACTPPKGGAWTLDGNCAFSGVNGVDNGNLIINSAYTLTVQAGAIFVWNPGRNITISGGGSIVISTTGSINQTYLWMVDADSDNYAPNTNQYASGASPGASYRRRNTITGTTDCNDADGGAWSYGYGYDGDRDGYGTSSYGCNNGDYPYDATSGTDCNDGNINIYIQKTCYPDTDGDTYTYGSSSICTNSGCTSPAGYRNAANGNDCNDNWYGIYQLNPETITPDGDMDNYAFITSSTYCDAVGLACVGAKSGTHYYDGTGYYWLACASATGWADCDDYNAAKWRMRYYDSDGDLHGVASATCVGNDANYVDDNTDCNDGSATYYANGYGIDNDGDNYGQSSSYGCNNGASPRTATAGTDCCDSDSGAKPGAGWHTSIDACTSWDWDCSGSVTFNDPNGYPSKCTYTDFGNPDRWSTGCSYVNQTWNAPDYNWWYALSAFSTSDCGVWIATGGLGYWSASGCTGTQICGSVYGGYLQCK